MNADSTLLERMVGNLVHNAIRYNRRGGHVAVLLEPGGGGAGFRLTVRDDGPGIPAEELARVTQRAFRGGEARQRRPTGLGLGLHIVRDVAERHRYRLRFKSPEGGRARGHHRRTACAVMCRPVQIWVAEEKSSDRWILWLIAGVVGVVVLIVGVAALIIGLTTAAVVGGVDEAQIASARVDAQRVRQAAQMYQLRRSPGCPSAATLASEGLLPPGAVRDPFGHDYRLTCAADGAITVTSAGPDGQPNTGDDISVTGR